jgi:putative transposase
LSGPYKTIRSGTELGSAELSRRKRYGRLNKHNAKIPRGHWLQEWEKQAILDFHRQHPDVGYRRLSYMLIDAGIVGVSPSSIYRVLKEAGELAREAPAPSQKGQGFVQPDKAYQHWHIDISYLNICGTFSYPCSLLDGYSRYSVHWEIRERMTEKVVETILQWALEAFGTVTPRTISDNDPQFVAREFKVFIRLCGMTHVRTSPYCPQSKGKIEIWHKPLKREYIRPRTLQSLADACGVVGDFAGSTTRSACTALSAKSRLGIACWAWTSKSRQIGSLGWLQPERRTEMRTG